jgi:hypothetical protein
MPACAVNSNATASARDRARGKHASAQCNVHPGEHSTAKRAVLCIVVLAQQARRNGASNVQTMGCEAAAEETEGGSVLFK